MEEEKNRNCKDKLDLGTIETFIVPGDPRLSKNFNKTTVSLPVAEAAPSSTHGVWQRLEFIEKRFLKIVSLSLMTAFILSFFFIHTVRAERGAREYTGKVRDNIASSFAALQDGDLDVAFNDLNKATENIKKLKFLLQSFGQDIKYFQITNNRSSIVALESILNASYDILNTLHITEINATKLSTRMLSKPGEYIFDLKSARESIISLLDGVVGDLDKSKHEIESATNSLPAKYQIEIANIGRSIEKILASINEVKSLLNEDIAWLSGETSSEKSVLVVFQNNAELRGGSGGSFGSFGVAKLRDGKLLSIDFGKNIFKLDNEFIKKECIPLENELKFVVIDECQKLKDSGWPIDGKEALQNIRMFYQKITGESIDGVVTIDATAVVDLLKITGPIEMTAYNQSIDSENFRTIIESEVHKDYFDRPGGKEENEPKKILSDMMPIFLEKIISMLGNKDSMLKISSSLGKSLREKDILLYFSKDTFAKRLEDYNLGGGVRRALNDYLYLNSSNINGFKSSLSITQNYKLKVDINPDGTIRDTLYLKREHFGSDLWPDGLNRNFMRMLTPDGSQIISFNPLSGNFQRYFDRGYKDQKPYWISNEAGKTVINFWMSTEPKKTSQAEISYVPNYRISTDGDFSYEILIQRQPGANPDNLELEINYPYGYRPTNVKNYDIINRKIIIKETVETDKSIKINFKKAPSRGQEER